MKRLILIIGLLLMPLLVLCDTIDFWHVFYNDAEIAQFNLTSQDLSIELDRKNIKSGDVITVKYWDDTPCVSCRYFLLVKDEEKREIERVETDKYSENLSLDLKSLVELGDENESKHYDFYYWEEEDSDEERDPAPMKLVLKLLIKDE